MSIPYDVFTGAFLSKITEYDFSQMDDFAAMSTVDAHMKRSLASFSDICAYDFVTTGDDVLREFNVSVPEKDIDEIADIVSEGMLMYWLKPFVYHQDNLMNLLNTRDFTTYSPGDFLSKLNAVHTSVQKNFTDMKREYSYRHGDLTDLHL